MKFSNGAFVFTRVSSSYRAMLPSDIEAIAQQHNLSATICPAYAGDRQIVSRAIAANPSALSKQGWLVRPIKQTHDVVVYGIVHETKDKANELLGHTQDDRLRWLTEHNNGAAIEGSHPVAQQIDRTYQE